MRISAKINSCSLSPMRKFHPLAVQAISRGISIYHLNIGQPDIPTPREYFEAVKNFSQPVLSYAPSCGIPELTNAVIAYYSKLGVNYSSDEVFVTTGGSEALLMVLLSILDEGDEVIIPEPFYPNYSTFVKAAGGVIAPLATEVEEDYRFCDREKIQKLITPKTRAIMFSNPGNPTGTVLSDSELRLLADIAKENGLYLISDEVYREFVYGGEELVTVGRFDDVSQNVVIIDSVSKRFSACGARIGVAITRNSQLQLCINKLSQSRLSVATLDQVAATALYGVSPDYFDGVRKEYKLRRDTCYDALKAIKGVVCAKPCGAFYIMAKLPVDDADSFQSWLLSDFSDNNETVMFAPGNGFYATEGSGKQEVRIAYVLEQKRLKRAMELLALAIEKYNDR